MGTKVEANKRNKRSQLLRSGYSLFVDKGVAETTISDIAKKSGLAKGTFYLYFNNKYDLRDELVARKSAQLLLDAQKEVSGQNLPSKTLEDSLLAIIDSVLNTLSQNKLLLKFIAKNLSWGIFRHAVDKVATLDQAPGGETAEPESFGAFYDGFVAALKQDSYQCDKPELLLFTIIELVSSTGYSTILYESPCTLQEYRPHLHRSIHQILEGYRKEPAD